MEQSGIKRLERKAGPKVTILYQVSASKKKLLSKTIPNQKQIIQIKLLTFRL